MKKLIHTFFNWLPIAFIATCLTGLIYVSVHQNYRQGANDPQIQMAEDYSGNIPAGEVDISKSLLPFVIVFDSNGKIIKSNAKLDSEVPSIPSGVFDYTKSHGEDRITWQPKDGVRVAAVVRYFEGKNTGYVLAGRNLREVEKRTSMLTAEVFGSLILILIGSFALIWIKDLMSN